VVISDNHLGIRLDSWVIHLSDSLFKHPLTVKPFVITIFNTHGPVSDKKKELKVTFIAIVSFFFRLLIAISSVVCHIKEKV
jgi:hypothetical protein